MNSDRIALKRSLSILRRLQRGPADRDTLMETAQIDLGGVAYDDADAGRSRKVFEHDLERLRDLGVHYRYDRKGNEYVLESFGAFSPVCLADAELDALAFLVKTFDEGAPNSKQVQQLLRRIVDWLPEGQQANIANRQQRFRLDLRRRDEETVAPAVEAAVNRALSQRRALRFAYRSSGQADGIPRIHTVLPCAQVFDLARGHLYLDAYWLTSDGPLGKRRQEKWQPFRMDNILDDDNLQVLPDRLPPELPRRPRFRLEYLLSPQIARLGHVTRHFEEMEVHEANAEGWVRVTGVTDNLFQAVRLLLGYGPNCKVVGGPEARREMQRLVAGLAQLYGE